MTWISRTPAHTRCMLTRFSGRTACLPRLGRWCTRTRSTKTARRCTSCRTSAAMPTMIPQATASSIIGPAERWHARRGCSRWVRMYGRTPWLNAEWSRSTWCRQSAAHWALRRQEAGSACGSCYEAGRADRQFVHAVSPHRAAVRAGTPGATTAVAACGMPILPAADPRSRHALPSGTRGAALAVRLAAAPACREVHRSDDVSLSYHASRVAAASKLGSASCRLHQRSHGASMVKRAAGLLSRGEPRVLRRDSSTREYGRSTGRRPARARGYDAHAERAAQAESARCCAFGTFTGDGVQGPARASGSACGSFAGALCELVCRWRRAFRFPVPGHPQHHHGELSRAGAAATARAAADGCDAERGQWRSRADA